MLDLREAARKHRPGLTTPSAQLTPAIIATWRARMVNEHRSSQVFEGLANQLAALGDVEAAATCRRFADEERIHGIRCGAVVEAIGGAALAPAPPVDTLPVHADTTPHAAVVRNIISIGCMSETIAVSLIGAERLEMPDGELRDLLETIWADEVGHARFGWLYVSRAFAALDASERDAVARYLPVAFAHLESHELAHIPEVTWPPEGAAYGLCNGTSARELFFDTVDTVIIPQLEAHGLPAEQAWQKRRSLA